MGFQHGVRMRTLFRRQTQQVNRLDRPQIGFLGIKAAGQQNLVNQLVQFTNIARNFVLGLVHGSVLGVRHELQPHANARQR